MANKPTDSWNETLPSGGRDINLGDDDVRQFKTQLREIIAVDHKMESSGQGATWGYHSQVTLIEAADIGTGATGYPILGAQTVDGKPELVYTDEDDDDVQITEVGYLYLGNARAPNDTYILGRNNADDADINIIKVNTSDELVLGAVTELPDTSKLASSGAPTADAQIANKKYVDDKFPTSSISEVLGAWASKSENTVYEAATDGFVCAISTVGTPGTGYISGYTDSSNPPTTLRAYNRNYVTSGPRYASIMMPVKKGDYWKVIGGDTETVYWIPLGS